MLNLLENYRVIHLDQYNWVFEEFRINKYKKEKWIRGTGYYPTLSSCLNALKEYILSEELTSKDYDVNEFIELLDKISNSYVNCQIKVEE